MSTNVIPAGRTCRMLLSGATAILLLTMSLVAQTRTTGVNYSDDFAELDTARWFSEEPIQLYQSSNTGTALPESALRMGGQGLHWAGLNAMVGDFELSVDCLFLGNEGSDSWAGVGWAGASPMAPTMTTGGYFALVRPNAHSEFLEAPYHEGWQINRGKVPDKGTGVFNIRVKRSAADVRVWINESLVYTHSSDKFGQGYPCLMTWAKGKVDVAWDNLRLNGTVKKDLPAKASSLPGTVKVPMADKAGQKVAYQVGESRFNMVYVPSGYMRYGQADSFLGLLDRPFLMGETEVPYWLWKTVRDWAMAPERGDQAYEFTAAWPGAIEGDSVPPEPYGTPDHPATLLYWRHAVVFCNALTEWYNAMTGSTFTLAYWTDPDYTLPLRKSTMAMAVSPWPGSQDMPYVLSPKPGNYTMHDCIATGFRLPTNREWDFAARYREDQGADGYLVNPGEYYPENHISGCDAPVTDVEASARYAVFHFSDRKLSEPVASRLPNPLGLYDMSGNAQEWVFDGDPREQRPYRLARGSGFYAQQAMETGISGINYPTLFYQNSWTGLRVARFQTAELPAAQLLKDDPLGTWQAAWNDGRQHHVKYSFSPDGHFELEQLNFPVQESPADSWLLLSGHWFRKGNLIGVQHTKQHTRFDGVAPGNAAYWIDRWYSGIQLSSWCMIRGRLYWGDYASRRIGEGRGLDGSYESFHVSNRGGINQWTRIVVTIKGRHMQVDKYYRDMGFTGIWPVKPDESTSARLIMADPLNVIVSESTNTGVFANGRYEMAWDGNNFAINRPGYTRIK